MAGDYVDGGGPQQSPDGLGIKPRPAGVVRVNRKAVIGVSAFFAAALIAVVLGVANRKPSVTLKTDQGSDHLLPAIQAGEEVTRDIPDGNLPERKAKDDKAQMVAVGILRTPVAASAPAEPASVPAPATKPPIQADEDDVRLSGMSASRRGANATPPVDPAVERARHLQEQREATLKQAMEAGTSPAGTGIGGIRAGSETANAGSRLAGLASGLNGSSGGVGGGLGGAAAPTNMGMPTVGSRGGPDDDQNKQQRKDDFLRAMEATPDRNYVKSTRKAGTTPFEIKAGWLIPAALEQGINSDLPGKVTARVTENVFDTATGRRLLIPQGATLMGTYDAHVAYGQDGLLVVWRRLIYPDGSSVDLEGMGGVDQSGYAGFRDEVDNHYMRLIGFGLATSLFSAAFEVSQNQSQSITGTPTPAQVAGAAVAQQMSQLGIEIARRNLAIQPTLEIRPGYQFNVRVEKDLIFVRPYDYGNAQ